jgi:hypothetical protein
MFYGRCYRPSIRPTEGRTRADLTGINTFGSIGLAERLPA